MWLNGTFTKATAASKGKVERFLLVHQWAKEHDDATGFLSGFNVHFVEL
jgi:hypothetical protein